MNGSAAGPAPTAPLDWIDGFVAEIRPHIAVRQTDALLIVLPNQAYRLNPSGLRLLEALHGGASLASQVGSAPPPAVAASLFAFFTSLVALMKGCLGEGAGWAGVERIPYTRPYHRLPVLSEVAVTYRCNLACRFCYAGHCRQAAAADLDEAALVAIFSTIRREAQVPSVSLTGGEPALRPDLVRLVERAVGLGLRVNLISNGTLLTPALAADLRAAGLASAQVSLEGADAATHEALTGVPGSFAATLAGVAALRQAGIAVHTNTTLTRGNLAKATALPAFAAGLGSERLSMNMVIPSRWLAEREPNLLLRYSEIGPVVLAVREAARAAGVRFLWYSPTPYCLFNPVAAGLGGKGCAACDGLLSVDASGRVLPCSSMFEPQGSLLEQGFSAVWESPGPQALRRKERAPALCRGCEHFELCEGACPLYWDVFGCDELTLARGIRTAEVGCG